jgi:hypothetical protein
LLWLILAKDESSRVQIRGVENLTHRLSVVSTAVQAPFAS